MHEEEVEVYFDKYCKSCKYEKTDEKDAPCNRCLDEPVNINSHKPVEWKEKTK